MFSNHIIQKATKLLNTARQKGVRISTAESCTGGLIIGLLTEVPGSSDVVDRGFITYTNQAKNEMVNVRQETLSTHGAVSEETVKAMATGAADQSGCELTIAVSGIAGPSGGTPNKPVGLVHFACYFQGNLSTEHHIFERTRSDVRLQSVDTALTMMLRALTS